ncbi:MAG: acetyl-CoA hydrolase/transferase C-terminal domain-containing protein [Syntrophomonadaceae bacterium]|nr:acetyl-CoA hydrolase/transferase C-terminal domain-containing protein [Syntrophomonadaceae bacterium]
MSTKAQQLLQQKMTTAEEAVKLVRSGDYVFYSEFAMYPAGLDAALAERIHELSDIKLYSVSYTQTPKVIMADLEQRHIMMNDWHCGVVSRRMCDQGLCHYSPVTYHQGPRIIKKYGNIGVAMVVVGPMDEKGYFNLGPVNSVTSTHIETARNIILEINANTPVCLGGNGESIHISQVDYVVQGDNAPLLQLPPAVPTDIDYKIADYVMAEMSDGACLQLGIGGLPNVIGDRIADSDLKELGFHSEMMMDSCVDMYEAGKITGTRKNIDRGKMVTTFALGTNKLYEFMDNNPVCAMYPVSYTNDPRIIALNDRVMAINSAMEIDLFTQVASETNGPRQISGTGGQLDFIFGAFNSHGGKGLICLPSTYTDKEGNVHSRIVPGLSMGTIVTVPRSIVQYVVTEYGIAQLKGMPTWMRAEAMIELAHPDFRDSLIKAGHEMKLWTRNNKFDNI